MELLQLEYFKMIAKTQNISAAAKELHVVQPSLSQLLKRLEQEVGVPLFDRVGKHIQLNTYGQVFLKYTEEEIQLALPDGHPLMEKRAVFLEDFCISYAVGSFVQEEDHRLFYQI